MIPPDRRTCIRTAVLLAIAGLLVGHAMYYDFVNDDAFISFRYADNLVRHGELVFNPGERVEGYTNFLWTLLMAGIIAVGLDPVPWSKALGIALGVATLLVVARFGARAGATDQEDGGSSLWDALPALFLAAAPAYACWSTGGLEVQLFTFTFTVGWTAYLRELRPGSRGFPWSGVWFALAALTRPEGMLVFGLTGLHRLGVLVAERRWPDRRDWLWGLGFAALFAPYYAWRWTYYGWPFPNTYYVKTGAASAWKPGLRYWWSWIRDHHLWIVPLLAGFATRHLRFLTLAFLYVTGLSLHVIRVGGDFMGLHRFLVPLMPLLSVLMAIGLRRLVALMRARRIPVSALAVAGVLLAVAVGWRAGLVGQRAMKPGSEGGVDRIGWLKMFAGQCTAIGLWLRENAPPDASLATTAAGIIPYYSRLYTLDVLGLNDTWIAHNVKPHGNRPGHSKAAPLDYILKKEIDYLVYHPTIAAQPPRQDPATERSWARRGYRWRAVRVPGLEPPWWGYWERTRKE